MFVIEDEIHGELQGEFESLEDAFAELERRAQIPWDQEPNVAPCQSWKSCGRSYEVVEYDVAHTPWREVRRIPALEVRESGVTWDASLARSQ